MKLTNTHRYDDIIDLPHYEPKNHPRMDAVARAAQFAPFAALTGHEEVIEETAKKVENLVNTEVVGEEFEDI